LGVEMLFAVQPAFDALLAGQGDSAIITSEQVSAIQAFLDALSAQASSELREAIAAERDRWGPLDGYVGKTMAEVQAAVLGPSIDDSAPVINAEVSGPLGANGWYVGDVTVHWTVTDPESAVSSSDGCTTTIITSDTPGQTLSCTATSLGGTATQSTTIRRDATLPEITCPSAISAVDGESVDLGTPTVSDNLTGTPVVTNDAPSTFPIGTTTVTWTATDDAGNQANCAQQVTVVEAPPPDNTRPIALPDAAATRRGQPVRIKVLANDYDRERNIDPTMVIIVYGPNYGAVQPNIDGTVTYTPPARFLGLAYFAYTVRDSLGLESNWAPVVVLVY
jgi:Bacterial Ig domain/HYR domain